MFLSGFMSTVWQAAIVRNGWQLGRGAPPYTTKWAPPEHIERALRATDRELALEEGRRRHAPGSASRLSCLWLAEDSQAGRTWVQHIVGPEAFVLRVRVSVPAAMARHDGRWLDRVHEEPGDADAVEGYWSREPLDSSDPLWEYLVEGAITFADEAELKRLREFIIINGVPPDLITAPPTQ
jgi:hypothetical protein